VPYRAGDQPQHYGEMWGGTFWAIRGRLGAESTDRIVALGWQSMPWPVEESRVASSFVRALLEAAVKIGGDVAAADVREILRTRNIPLPS
jgi:hypothetical protein